MYNLLMFGKSKRNNNEKGVFSMTTIIGWGLVVTGAAGIVVKVLTDLGIIPVING